MPRRAPVALLLISAAVLAQEPAFVSVQSVSAPVERLELSPGVRLELAAGELTLVRGGEARPAARTSATGRVHAMTLDANGTLFAACDAGLFVLDAEHPVLDAADVRDGVPAGAPRSVFADGKGRLWLCSDREFGVMDVRFGFGRTFTAADGVPAPPFVRVADGGGGRVVLVTAAGAFAYTPDRGPPPRARNGVVRESVGASTDGVAAVTLDVEALGGAVFRQRRRHHHLLQPVDGGALRGLGPGRHVVEVHAVDRDLRRALAGEYTVTVPLPKALDPRVLPAAAAFAALLLFVCAWRCSEPAAARARRLAGAAGRTALLGVVALQLLAACLGYGRSWPFVGFSMYTETYRENAILHRPRIVALRADGSRRPLHEYEAGVMQDGYWQMLAEVVHGGDAAARAFLAQLDARHAGGEPAYSGFLLGDGRIRLTANGPVDVAPTVFVRWQR